MDDVLCDPDVESQLSLYGEVKELMESHDVRTHDGWKSDQLR